MPPQDATAFVTQFQLSATTHPNISRLWLHAFRQRPFQTPLPRRAAAQAQQTLRLLNDGCMTDLSLGQIALLIHFGTKSDLNIPPYVHASMNIVLPLDVFDINHVFYQEPVKNTVMDNSQFVRLVYSDSLLMLNGIYLQFALQVMTVERSFNKYKCTFNKTTSQPTLLALCAIEHDLLMKANIGKDKTAVHRVTEQLNNGFLKVFKGNSDQFIIKIYGIWESDTEYGLTYKIND